MPFDNFDKDIKESLEKGSHSYDKSSWDKMEVLLEKHMPQKKDARRRFIFFLLLFILIGGVSIYFGGEYFSKKITEPVANESVLKNNKGPENPEPVIYDTPKTGTTVQLVEDKSNAVSAVKDNLKEYKKAIVPKNQSALTVSNTKPLSSGIRKESKKETGSLSQNIIPETSGNDFNTTGTTSALPHESEKTTDINKAETEAKETESKIEKENAITDQIKQEIKKPVSKKRQFFLNNVLFSVSAGPDMSSVGNNTGNVKLNLGAGIGYKISKQLTIRTGLLIGRKVYKTDPEDYNPPANFWAYYPDLKTIDADCKVLEIPITLEYQFGFSKKQNWFVSAGVSSLLMKKEVYNYYYKPVYSSQYVYYSRTFENKNKHYFSILNLSGGYSRKISPSISLQAEPYFKIAMKGVGYGKVKLNSAGLLFTAIIQPFQRKN